MTLLEYKEQHITIEYSENKDGTITIHAIYAKNGNLINDEVKNTTVANIKEYTTEFKLKLIQDYKNDYFIFKEVYKEYEDGYKRISRGAIQEMNLCEFDIDSEDSCCQHDIDVDEVITAIIDDEEDRDYYLRDLGFDFDEDSEEDEETQIENFLNSYDFSQYDLKLYADTYNITYETEHLTVTAYEYHDGSNWKKEKIADEHETYCDEVENVTYLEIAIDEEVGEWKKESCCETRTGIKYSITTSYYQGHYEDSIELVNKEAYKLTEIEIRKLKLENYLN